MGQKEYSAKKTLKNSTIYFVTGILQKGLSFFLLPLYTIYLKPDDYGLVALILTFFGVISLLITLALNGAIARYYFVYKSDPRKQKEFIGTIIISVIINCLFWFVLILSLRNVIIRVFIENVEFFPYIFIALLSTVTAPVYSIYQTILQIKQDAKGYSANSMSFFAVAISLNIVCIVGFKLGATGLLLANAIPNILFCIIAITALIKRKYILITFKWAYLVEALRFSIPLIPHLLSGTIADYISKNFLYLKSNLANVGLYNIAFQFGSILDILLSSISNAIGPLVYDTLDNHRENEQQLVKTTTLVFKIICFFALGLSLVSKEVIFLMTSNDSFHAAWKAIPIIAFGVLFNSLYSTYATLLFYNIKGTRYIWIASVSGNLTNIAFTFWFTSQLLYLTPAFAGVFHKITLFFIVYIISRKLEPVQYELKKMMLIILLFVISSAIGLAPEFIMPSEHLSLYMFLWKALVFIIASTILLFNDRAPITSFILNHIPSKKRVN